MEFLSDMHPVMRGGGSLVNISTVFSKDNKYLFCGSGNNVKVFSITSGLCLQILKGHTDKVTCIINNPSNQFQIYSGSLDKSIIKWNFEDGVFIKKYILGLPICALYSMKNQEENNFLAITTDELNQNFSLTSIDFNSTTNDEISPNYLINKFESSMHNWHYGAKMNVFAYIKSRALFIYNLATKKLTKHKNKDKNTVLSCVVCHPTEACIATGLSNGQILIWRHFLTCCDSNSNPDNLINPVISYMHWHSLSVRCLSFTAEGSYLMSGGHECVMVKWSIHSMKKDTFPRLGSPIINISISEDATIYATSHVNNGIQIISSDFKVVQVIQGLVKAGFHHKKVSHMSKSSLELNDSRVGLIFEPRLGCLVANANPGHLQFYDVERDTQVFMLDVVKENYISPENLKNPLPCTDVQLAAFDNNGNWFATLESNIDIFHDEIKLKFWNYNKETQDYVLNTCINQPHKNSPVTCLKISGIKLNSDASSTQFIHMALTTSDDCTFRIWDLVDDYDIYRSNWCWKGSPSMEFRNLKPGIADFSQDGSLIAVGFGPTLTLWDSESLKLCNFQTLDPERKNMNDINLLEFGKSNSNCPFLFISTKMQLFVWNVLTCSIQWMISLRVTSICSSPYSKEFCIFSTEKKLLIFDAKFSKPLLSYDLTSSTTQIISSVFMKQKLFFVNENNELYSLEEKKTNTNDISKTSALNRNLSDTNNPGLWRLLAEQSNKGNKDQIEDSTLEEAEQTKEDFFLQIQNLPSHALPQMKDLCFSFLATLLKKKSPEYLTLNNADDAKEIESSSEIEDKSDSDDNDDSNVDMDTNDNMDDIIDKKINNSGEQIEDEISVT